jgi:hypothetical protein
MDSRLSTRQDRQMGEWLQASLRHEALASTSVKERNNEFSHPFVVDQAKDSELPRSFFVTLFYACKIEPSCCMLQIIHLQTLF